MDLTTHMIEAVPSENLRVPRADFIAVWSTAEQLCDERRRGDTCGGWYVAGVVITCRWLAAAVVPLANGRSELAWAPITMRSATAHEELIAAECLAAEKFAIRHPEGMEGRPGWIEAVVATLDWAWRGSGVPPLGVSRAAAG